MKQRPNRGFTLIEAIVSIAIISLIVIAFAGLFGSAHFMIVRAGNRGEAIGMAQQAVELDIAKKDTFSSTDLELTFTNGLSETYSYSIPGGIVESTQTVRSGSSTIQSFVAMVPTIELDPFVVFESDIMPWEMEIEGTDTHFSSLTVFEIWDSSMTNLVHTIVPDPVTMTTEASFDIPEPLVNSQGDYVVRAVTTNSPNPVEYARARLSIAQSAFMAGGNASLYASSMGNEWVKRSAAPYSDMPSFPNITAATYGNDRYVMANQGGQVLVGKNYTPWVQSNLSTGEVRDIVWSTQKQQFFAVDALGEIFQSSDGFAWSSSYVNSNELPYHALAALNDGSVIAVGEDGLICVKGPGETGWTEQQLTGNPVLEGVSVWEPASGSSLWIVVGTLGGKGYIAYSDDDGSTWVDVVTIGGNDFASLHDIVLKSTGDFVAVGDDGTALFSSDGMSWATASIPGPTKDMFAVAHTAATNRFVAVGEDRTIAYSEDGMNWSTWSNVPGDHLLAIAGR